jgi:hypothetical protein
MTAKTAIRALVGIVAATACSMAMAAANFTIVNINPAGVGFNDPTPVAPVGGNAGVTLGQQRLNAFQHAANVWGAKLDSTVTILVRAQFSALSCNATSAVLGSAGPRTVHANFTGAVLTDTWYHQALANKQSGEDRDVAFEDMSANFNVNLGNPGCLTGSPFYLGLDNNAPTGHVDLVAVLLHEFGHGLGFSTTTSGISGNYLSGLFPSSYDHFLFDNTQGLTWTQMTPAQRQASAINPRNVVWIGDNVTAAAASVLLPGTPTLQVIEPASIAGNYAVGSAAFGPGFDTIDLTRQVMPIVEGGFIGLACDPFDAANQRFARNRIVIVQRGVCGFVVKVKNAQDAGARGVIVMDNVAGGPPAGLGGVDPTITIPSVRVTLADGITLLNGMDFGNPSGRSVNEKVRLFVDPSQMAGADVNGYVMVYTPAPFQSGSSVSHWDTIATPNLLMEPSINADLTHEVEPPYDLTLPMFYDIGW